MSTSDITADNGMLLAGAQSTTCTLRAPERTRARTAEAACVTFLLMVFVGLSPFALPPSPQAESAAVLGMGDALRQACYLAVFVFIAAMAGMRRGWRAIAGVPLPLVVLLGWCLLSSAWSIEPGVTFRRAVLVAVVTLSAFLITDTVGTTRTLALLRYVLAGVVILCWISLPFIPQARHFANDFETGVAGDWRGLYVHKNIAGAVCASATLIFLFFAATKRSRTDLLLCLAALGFLIGTNSKASLGLLPAALLAGAIYRAGARKTFDREIALVAATLLLCASAGLVWVFWDSILPWLQDPALFTGRGAVWQAEIAFVRDHPLLGSGFGTFAYTGERSPIYDYIDAAWVGTVANGHNGYLELLVTIGIPGFVLAMLCLLVRPASSLAASRLDLNAKTLLFTLFAFLSMHNFVETDFLRTDAAAWVMFLLVIAMLGSSQVRRAHT